MFVFNINCFFNNSWWFFFFKIYNITLDLDPDWARILDPDTNSVQLNTQHCTWANLSLYLAEAEQVLPEPGHYPPPAGLLPLGGQEHGQGRAQAVVDRVVRWRIFTAYFFNGTYNSSSHQPSGEEGGKGFGRRCGIGANSLIQIQIWNKKFFVLLL